MMDLILWRHAHARDLVEGEEDIQRPLTPRGEKQAAHMAAWLRKHLPDGLRVLASPAVRTEQTVKALNRKYKLRAELLPKAPRIAPDELVELGEAYARATGYPIQYQWTLIDGINDSEAEMDGIVHLLSGKYALMNLIPYNTTAALDYRRPAVEKVTALTRYLHARGIRTTVRNSAGQDVDGGCGQLRARNLERAGGRPQKITLQRAAGENTSPG